METDPAIKRAVAAARQSSVSRSLAGTEGLRCGSHKQEHDKWRQHGQVTAETDKGFFLE